MSALAESLKGQTQSARAHSVHPSTKVTAVLIKTLYLAAAMRDW